MPNHPTHRRTDQSSPICLCWPTNTGAEQHARIQFKWDCSKRALKPLVSGCAQQVLMGLGHKDSGRGALLCGPPGANPAPKPDTGGLWFGCLPETAML